jgi:hypothetical protein
MNRYSIVASVPWSPAMRVSSVESCIGYMYYATRVVEQVAKEVGCVRGGYIAVEQVAKEVGCVRGGYIAVEQVAKEVGCVRGGYIASSKLQKR